MWRCNQMNILAWLIYLDLNLVHVLREKCLTQVSLVDQLSSRTWFGWNNGRWWVRVSLPSFCRVLLTAWNATTMINYNPALQAATILVAMASEKISFSPFRYSIQMRKPKVSVNWKEVKLYFLHPTEEQNLQPPRQRQFSVVIASVTCWPWNPCLSRLSWQDWTLQDFQCIHTKNNFIWERLCLILCIPYKFWVTVLWKNSDVV